MCDHLFTSGKGKYSVIGPALISPEVDHSIVNITHIIRVLAYKKNLIIIITINPDSIKLISHGNNIHIKVDIDIL